MNRQLTVFELIQIQRMFSFNRGYKDLIRDFKNDFNIVLPKQKAKEFMRTRSWRNVLKYITGDDVVPADENDYKIQEYNYKDYELLIKMIELNKQDEEERKKDIEEFKKFNYYIPKDIKYFNFPIYSEIITYKHKDPFLKCFLIENQKVSKIEDVPITDDLPMFLLEILRVINRSNDEADDTKINIFDSDLFKKYNFTYKS